MEHQSRYISIAAIVFFMFATGCGAATQGKMVKLELSYSGVNKQDGQLNFHVKLTNISSHSIKVIDVGNNKSLQGFYCKLIIKYAKTNQTLPNAIVDLIDFNDSDIIELEPNKSITFTIDSGRYGGIDSFKKGVNYKAYLLYELDPTLTKVKYYKSNEIVFKYE